MKVELKAGSNDNWFNIYLLPENDDERMLTFLINAGFTPNFIARNSDNGRLSLSLFSRSQTAKNELDEAKRKLSRSPRRRKA